MFSLTSSICTPRLHNELSDTQRTFPKGKQTISPRTDTVGDRSRLQVIGAYTETKPSRTNENESATPVTSYVKAGEDIINVQKPLSVPCTACKHTYVTSNMEGEKKENQKSEKEKTESSGSVSVVK